jgi:hypothetical protein
MSIEIDTVDVSGNLSGNLSGNRSGYWQR